MKLLVALAILGFTSIQSSPLSRGRRLNINGQRSQLVGSVPDNDLLLPGEFDISDDYDNQELNDECYDEEEPVVLKETEPLPTEAPIDPPCYDEEIDYDANSLVKSILQLMK